MYKKTVTLLLLSIICRGAVFSQQDSSGNTGSSNAEPKIEILEGKLGGLEESYLESKSVIDKLKKIKVSGYMQAQLRYLPDTTGLVDSSLKNLYPAGEFQGGKFPNASKTAFHLRRARLKVTYESSLSGMVLQLDALPDKISLKDAYLWFTEPWLKSISFKAGVFDRPFGYEISYSSSSRESPERSRVFQTLFPGERDLGFSLQYIPSDNVPPFAGLFNLKGGIFAGNGINAEFDDLRDFIGRAGVVLPLTNVNLSVEGGVSGYIGAVRNRNDSLYELRNGSWSGSDSYFLKNINRRYIGTDLQLFYGNIPYLGGVSLRGEIISGEQPGTKSSNVSPKSADPSTQPVYLRNFIGYYGMLVLNIDPLRSQLVGKYDVLDPNTELEGKEITNTADIRYTTIGTGLVFHLNSNVYFMAYYDRIQNELVSVRPFTKDVNDNVFTFRIQYKF